MEVEKKRKTKKGVQIKSKEEKRVIRRAKEKEKRQKKKKGVTFNVAEGDGEAGGDGIEVEKEFAAKEQFKFDEIAHAPPTKLAGFKESMAERRPGQKANLLLAQKLNKKTGKGQISLARQKVLADEREKVIQEYRKIRNEKYQQSNALKTKNN